MEYNVPQQESIWSAVDDTIEEVCGSLKNWIITRINLRFLYPGLS